MINTFTVVAVAVAAFAVALHQIREHILTPLWEFLENLVEWSKAHPTLMEIAAQFEPNAGTSLYDRLTRVEDATTAANRGVEELHDEFAALSNLVRQHIIDTRVGGQRRSDPKEH